MAYYLLKGEGFNSYISSLQKKFEVIAPVQRDIIRFDILNEGENIVFENPIYPPKKYFLPAFENMLSFKDHKIIDNNETKKRVIFMNKGDSNALLVLDHIYLDKHPDPYYKKMRNNTLIIEIPLESKNSFYSSMDIIDNFDLRIIPEADNFFVEVGSAKGKKLLTPFIKRTNKKPKGVKLRDEKKISKSDLKNARFSEKENKTVWTKHAKECLSCGACTNTCPTCCCFDVQDYCELGGNCSARNRKWSSCQVLDFSRVAGGYVFRKERPDRVKHRILHKFKYHINEFDKNMCIGCGRCITNCPTEIDITKIVKELK